MTDRGVVNLGSPELRRVNLCGAYKVTDAGTRYLLSLQPQLLTYRRAQEFGVPPPEYSRGRY